MTSYNKFHGASISCAEEVTYHVGLVILHEHDLGGAEGLIVDNLLGLQASELVHSVFQAEAC